MYKLIHFSFTLFLFECVLTSACANGNDRLAKALVEISPDDFITFSPEQVVKDCSLILMNREALTPDVINKLLRLRGKVLVKLGQFDNAFEDFISLSNALPKDAEARALLALCLLKKNKAADAVRESENSIRLNPKIPATYYVRGLIALESKEYDLALKQASFAISSDPKFSAGYYLAASAHYKRKDPVKCVEKLDQMFAICPLSMEIDRSCPFSENGVEGFPG